MTLEDLPALTVEEIAVISDGIRVFGRFSHLNGVQLGRSFLYCGDAQWVGDLIELDPETRAAVFSAPRWVRRELVRVGSVVPWLPGGWQYFHVNMILYSTWEPRVFVSTDAQHFREGDVCGWTKVGSQLRENQVATHVEPDGWDHEECWICYAHIGRGGSPDGYVNRNDLWLCSDCYERYGRPRDLGFIFAT